MTIATSGRSRYSARDISQMLNAQALSLAKILYPSGFESGVFWNIGSVHGDAGDSLKIRIRGRKEGSWADYSCDENDREGKGDMLKLIQLGMCNGDMAKAIAWAKSWLHLDEDADPERLEQWRKAQEKRQRKAEQDSAEQIEKSRLKAFYLWHYAKPLRGTPAQAYLEGRGIDFARLGRLPNALRFRADCWNVERKCPMPALLSAVMLYDKHIATHRTFLEEIDGRWVKARVAEAKKVLGNFHGGVIPLHKGDCRKTLRDIDVGTPIYLSEGLEDGLTVAMARPDLRVLAGVSLGNLGNVILPEQAGPLTLICQNDPPGSKAEESFQAQIGKLQRAGRAVHLMWPKPHYKDFNDQLNDKRLGGGDAR